MNEQQAVAQFRGAAIAKHDYVSIPRSFTTHREMADAQRFLLDLGLSGTSALRSLLRDPSPSVRFEAAAVLVGRGDETAAPVLVALAQEAGLIGVESQHFLEDWDRMHGKHTD